MLQLLKINQMQRSGIYMFLFLLLLFLAAAVAAIRAHADEAWASAIASQNSCHVDKT